MITIFFGGKLGILGGGSFYFSNTLDRTLTLQEKNIPVWGESFKEGLL